MLVEIEYIQISTKRENGGYWIQNIRTNEGVAVTEKQMQELMKELFDKVF